ncbi:CRP-like cAMP-binding protein [Sphaerotilus hippei]|uniref:CRP-like cAMP-binding protein n=1 Tax=Sphaerotilus hippei TaxID=744406 RepID=A0A318H3G2_9BURK|nr:Crp/Fnr family transcriptional regulator [Sphaerotilus hippei]PXW98086.1 CRP-like cAMP-binding protein [Sphaerotilus hippei]
MDSSVFSPFGPAAARSCLPVDLETADARAARTLTWRSIERASGLDLETQHFPRGTAIVSRGGWHSPGRVIAGAIRLAPPGLGAEHLVLALPGDLVGIELLTGERGQLDAIALVGTTVEWLQPQALKSDGVALVAALQARQHHQAVFAQLRHGPVAERVLQLLRVITLSMQARGRAIDPVRIRQAVGDGGPGAPACELPSLADMADVIDSAPETVSRVISAMRRQRWLIDVPERCHDRQRLDPTGRRVRLMPRLCQPAPHLPPGMTRSRTSTTAGI